MRRSVKLPIALMAAMAIIPTMLPAAVSAQETEPRFTALVFSKVTNFFHESIPYGIAAIESLGDEHDFEVVVTDDASIFNDDDLTDIDVVVFNNTNSTPQAGDLLNADEREAFTRYIQGGGGFAGLHSASGSERDWEWYEGLVGTMFTNHPPGQLPDGTIPGRVKVTDRVHPSTHELPEVWRFDEEWYNFAPDPTPDVHVLAQIDTKIGITGLQMGHHHPFAWCHNYDGGRSWYTAGGHSPDAFSDEDYLGHLLGGIEWAAGVVDADCGATIDREFDKTLLTDDLVDPMEVSIAEDGRVFVIERAGGVKMWDPQTEQTSTIGEIEVVTPLTHTLGLNGLALDPDFGDNGWLYLYYTAPDDAVHRLTRITFDGEQLDMSSAAVLLEVPIQVSHNAHEAGSMTWDEDGNLFLATGDNSAPTNYSPIDERPGQEHLDAQGTSGNTNDLRGKILRITPTEDGSYTIPDGNLFSPGMNDHLFPGGEWDSELVREEIYTMGHRQPYRIHYDAPTGRLLWGDVGEDANAWSATRGPLGLDDFQFTTEPTNGGWPYCNGRYPYLAYDEATGVSGAPFDCEGGPTNTSPNNTGLTQLPPAAQAQIWYPYEWSNYQGQAPWPELGNGGRLALGGPVYRYDADLESETKFPEYYDGKWFIAEWARGWIKTASIAEQDLTFNDYPDVDAGDVFSIDPWLDSETFLRPHDLEFGPDGSLYLLEWGSNYGGAGRGEPNNDSGLYRIDYLHGERPPVAQASATPDSGPVPLEVSFSSEGTFHPSGIAYELEWDLGDGTTSDEPHPTHVYQEPGSYLARLIVTDVNGRESVASVPIAVGNTRPEVTIVRPPHAAIVGEGDAVDFEIAVEDAEDGSTDEATIDCDRVEVVASVLLGNVATELERHQGCNGTFFVDSVEGQVWTDDVTYHLEATYTDEGAPDVEPLTGSDEVTLQPRRKQAEHFTDSFGVNVIQFADNEGSAQQLGGAVVGSISDGNWVAYGPINLEGIDALTFHGNSAGVGGVITPRANTPDGPLIADPVTMPNTGNQWRANFIDVTTELYSDVPSGPFTLYLTFTTASPPTVNDLFNVHWIDFVGEGLGQGAAVAVTDATADLPLFAHHDNVVEVTLDNYSPNVDAEVEVFATVPSGWTTTGETVTVAAGSSQQAEITVTPDTAPGFADIVVGAASDDLPVLGTSTLTAVPTVPHGDDVVLALDGGTPASPVLDSYQRLSEQDAWSAQAGFGWVGNAPQSRDREGPDDLRRDFVADSSSATLRIAVPAGEHRIWMLRGDPGFTAHPMTVSGDDGTLVSGSSQLPAGTFEWMSFVVDEENEHELDLHLAGTPGQFWHVGALVVEEVTTGGGVVEASLDPAEPDGEAGWYVSPVSLLLSSEDAGAELAWRLAGDDEWTAWTDPVTFTEDGSYTVEYLTAADDAPTVPVSVGEQGDTFTPDEITVSQGTTVAYTLIDGFHNVVIEDPDGNEIDRSGAPGSDWGTWEFSADDAGVFTFRCEPHPGMEGTLTVEPAGGGSGIGEVSFQLDQTAPDTEASLEGELDDGAYVGEVTLTLDADDATSGVAQTHWREAGASDHEVYDAPVVFDEPGAYAIEYRSVDVAGNVEDWQAVTFEIVEDGPPPVELELDLAASARCVAGNVFVTVMARNDNGVAVDLQLESEYGSRAFVGVVPDRFASHAFNTRSGGVDGGSVTVRASALVDGDEISGEWTVDFDGLSCD